MTTEIKIPASTIVALLKSWGKTPKIARTYSENIIYSHRNGRIYDENIEEAIKALEAPLRKNTHEIA